MVSEDGMEGDSIESKKTKEKKPKTGREEGTSAIIRPHQAKASGLGPNTSSQVSIEALERVKRNLASR